MYKKYHTIYLGINTIYFAHAFIIKYLIIHIMFS